MCSCVKIFAELVWNIWERKIVKSKLAANSSLFPLLLVKDKIHSFFMPVLLISLQNHLFFNSSVTNFSRSSVLLRIFRIWSQEIKIIIFQEKNTHVYQMPQKLPFLLNVSWGFPTFIIFSRRPRHLIFRIIICHCYSNHFKIRISCTVFENCWFGPAMLEMIIELMS